MISLGDAGADEPAIRCFYDRLNHKGYGLTELAVIDPNRNRIIATGFYNNADAFVAACNRYNSRYNVYAGRNPRPYWLPKAPENTLDTRIRQRAKDNEIEWVTAISLDIDPIRPKGTSASDDQRQQAIRFALRLREATGGWVDDSGNGAYLWMPFSEPIHATRQNRATLKQRFRQWQKRVIESYRPSQYDLRIDGCYDFSRLKKVIGTMSVKGRNHRRSRFARKGTLCDRVRDEILRIEIGRPPKPKSHNAYRPSPNATSELPPEFVELMERDASVEKLWTTPAKTDLSARDWKLACACVEAGITNPDDLAAILMHSPYGKCQRDGRQHYLATTVQNLMEVTKNGIK